MPKLYAIMMIRKDSRLSKEYRQKVLLMSLRVRKAKNKGAKNEKKMKGLKRENRTKGKALKGAKKVKMKMKRKVGKDTQFSLVITQLLLVNLTPLTAIWGILSTTRQIVNAAKPIQSYKRQRKLLLSEELLPW